jgi:phage-related protein
MAVAEKLIAAVVAKVVSAVSAQAVGGDSLAGDLGKAVGTAGGAKAGGAVKKCFGAKDRKKAIEAALAGSLAAVEASYSDFINWSGGFSSVVLRAAVRS